MSVSGPSGIDRAPDGGSYTGDDRIPEATNEAAWFPALARSTNASSAWTVRVGVTSSAPAAGRAASMPMLRSGSEGAAVRELQTRLNESRVKLGLRPIPADGGFGPKTAEAVIQFQRMWGLDADGIVGPATWRRLLGETSGPAPTPAAGSTAARVLAHRDAILATSEKYGLPPALIAAVIEKESGGRAEMIGITDDRGLMQINPRSHPAFFRLHDWKDPKANVDYGTSVLAACLRAFDGDVRKGIAAYNAGVGGVRGGLSSGRTLDEITYKPHYVSDILESARRYAAYF